MHTPRQQGMATLSVALILLMAATIMTLAMANDGILEQRMTGNELRTTEARHRAEAVLEEAFRRLETKRIPAASWQPAGNHVEQASLDVPAHLQGAAGSGEEYQARITLLRMDSEPGRIEVQARARAESGVTASLRQYVQLQDTLGRELPPLVVDGCISGGFGGVQLFPVQPDNLSLATTLAHPHAGCLDTAGLFLEGGATGTGFAGAGDLWDSLFSLSKTEFRERSSQEQAAVETGELDAGDRTYYWITEGGDDWHQDLQGFEQGALGAPGHPVWLLISAAADCPPLPPGVTFYGILYYETGESGACDAGGWGNARVIGSLLVEGSLRDLAGGSSLHPFSEGGRGGLPDNLPPLHAVRLPGTWRDF